VYFQTGIDGSANGAYVDAVNHRMNRHFQARKSLELIAHALQSNNAVSACSYCTAKVSFVAWVNVVEPDVKVPVTVRL
jgi:hypothetical protein